MKYSEIRRSIKDLYAGVNQLACKIARNRKVHMIASHFRRCLLTILGWLVIAIYWTVFAIVDLLDSKVVRDFVFDASGWIKTGFSFAPQSISRGIVFCNKQIDRIPFGSTAQKRALIGCLLLVFFIGFAFDEPETPDEKVIPEKIVIPKEPLVPELPRFTDVPNFKEFAAGQARKDAFFGYFLPLIEAKNKTILTFRQVLLQWNAERNSISGGDQDQIRRIAVNYRLKDFDVKEDDHWDALLQRVNAIPPSLALAQAANESGWGTSRFAREANNYFGQWCYEAGCGLVPNQRDKNKTHEVAAFESPEESVARYIHNLNSNRAYQVLRDIRSQLLADHEPVTGYALAEGLIRYSERGVEYISELRAMIEFNKLTRFDMN